jgi:hypothetical protein
MVFGKAESEETPSAAPEPMQPIEGRIASIQGDTIVVELTVPAMGLLLAFDDATAVLTLGNGNTVEAILEPGLSTREGHHAPGLILRIVLRLATNERIASLLLTLPGSNAVVVAVNRA